ncbi:hypothetical protein T265_11267 [Opisthorchis viverrini]|uniref:Reverse transcriptase domain-containing protein n=1 Tax=Opisthorchis viverrini TaxID=6198 RepID=A0A074Z3L4_OPIVI|nr:hypothetical protein T265_11267 [Opisthorchis viverrini]KER20107.1 hypothetical protein T265_11267 [Opisthorchis viverrini]
MGSPISGFIAEIAMQKLERTVLPDINPKLWVRYVDDTFVIIKKRELQRAIQLINSVSDDIKFTMEEENNNKLAVLNVLVLKYKLLPAQSPELKKEIDEDGTIALATNASRNLQHARSLGIEVSWSNGPSNQYFLPERLCNVERPAELRPEDIRGLLVARFKGTCVERPAELRPEDIRGLLVARFTERNMQYSMTSLASSKQ